MPHAALACPDPPAPSMRLTMPELCHEAGGTRGLLRLDDRDGLMAQPPRTRAGDRCFSRKDVARLLAIRQLKDVGDTLKEIAALLDEHRQRELDPQRLRSLARAQLGVIDARIARGVAS